MSINYSPELVTDGAVFVGDARDTSTATAGSRLYDQAGVDSTAVKLLIHGNEGSGQSFTDSSLSNHTVTAVGNTTHSTVQTKFSGGSIYFGGATDYLSVPDSSDWAFGTDDFTIDFWFNPTSFSSYTGLIVQNPTTFGSTDSSNGLFIEVDYASTKLRLFIRDGSDMFTEINQTGIVAGTWNHVAVVRETSANKITMYLNGSSVGSSTWSGSTSYPDFATPLLIGVRNDQSDYFNGYMDEIRITKGAALWTQNFTPPARRDTLSISDGMMYNGSCVDFDGTDDYIDLGSIAFGTKDISVAVWFTLDAFDDDYACIFNNRTSSAGNAGFEIRQRTSGTKIQLQFDWGAGSNSVDTGALATGTWHHIVATLDRSGYLRGYLNGVEFGSPLDISSHSATSITNDNSAFIGADGYLSNFWNGQAADLKIYENTVLSASQVTEIYNDSKVIIPSNVSQTNLMGWWPLVDGAGTIAYDGSGNGNDGTLTNMTSADWLTGQTGCPQLVEGYNRPMWFSNAGSDYVQVASDGSSTFANQSHTVAGWIYTPDATPSGDRVLFSYDYTSHVNPYYSIHVRLTGASGRLYFIWNDGTTYHDIYKDSAFTDNTWHHYACTFISGSQKIYIDGAEVASGTRADTITYYNQEVWIGAANFGGYWDGLINETVVYNSVLTLAQVQALAATGPNGGPLPPDPMSLSNSSNVVGYWRNDGNVTWTDRSANSNTGTANGSPNALLFEQGYNDSASTSTGRDGQGFPLLTKNVGAIGFGGSDYVSIAGLPALTTKTVAFWVQVGAGVFEGAADNIVVGWGSGWTGLDMADDGGATACLRFHTSAGANPGAARITGLEMNQWYYLAYSEDGTTNKYYKNGSFVASTTIGGATTSATTIALGARTSLDYNYSGAVSGLQLYNRALSESELLQNYNAQRSRFT